MHAILYFQVSWPLVQRNQDWFTAVKYNKMSLIWNDISDKLMAYGHVMTWSVFSNFQCVGYDYEAFMDLNVWERPSTQWGRVTHICVNKLTIIGSHNGLSPGRRQAIIWTNAAILLIGPLGTNFSEIWIELLTCSFKKMHLKMSSGMSSGGLVSASIC